MTQEERKQLVERRKVEYHQEHKAPDFAPSDGFCWHCHTDLVKHYGKEWPAAYITGCPICHRTYCD